MERQIHFVEGPLTVLAPLAWPEDGQTGAIVEFYGVVRRQENNAAIVGLHYEAYPGMARKEFDRLLDELAPLHPCHSIHITHSTGGVPAGQPSLHVRVRAKHRAEAFALAQSLIDRMKQEVPIWKHVQ